MFYFISSLLLVVSSLCYSGHEKLHNLGELGLFGLKKPTELLFFSVAGDLGRDNEDRVIQQHSRDISFYGIADGTKGGAVAEFLSGTGNPLFKGYKNDVDFDKLSKKIQIECQNNSNGTSRSSSTLNCLIDDKKSKKLTLFNVGDSRTYTVDKNGRLLCTKIHNVTNDDEVSRITKYNRIHQNQNVTCAENNNGKHFSFKRNKFELSRAFGFQGEKIEACKPEPDIYDLPLDTDFVIIMSDGLEHAGIKKVRDALPTISAERKTDEMLQASFIYKLVSTLATGGTDQVIKDFRSYHPDDKSMIFIPMHYGSPAESVEDLDLKSLRL